LQWATFWHATIAYERAVSRTLSKSSRCRPWRCFTARARSRAQPTPRGGSGASIGHCGTALSRHSMAG
jgi:hypothetical protein